MEKKLTLRKTLNLIKGDYSFFFNGKTKLIIDFFLNPSLQLSINLRFQKYWIYGKGKFLGRILRYYQNIHFSCYIHPKAEIDEKFKVPHPTGIVIGEGTIIGKNVCIYQHVTIGSSGKKNELREYPHIGDNVTIYAGAKIIGGIKIGDNSIIGANSVVNKDIPANSVAVGIPAKIINK
ncbi:serine O-acetyltransferase EpsC [Niallia circulans]|uniref:serine O-acetyltransferase EpsC n=1 Tax=Niallia circulans TaxID=1397 RepID=UPI003526803E